MELLPHEKLKIFRQRKSWTQEKLASIIRCSQMQVSRLERGKVPNDEEKLLIEKALGTNIWTQDVEEKQ